MGDAVRRRSVAALGSTIVTAFLLVSCSDASRLTAPDAGPLFNAQSTYGLSTAIAAQERHTSALLRIPGVVGTAIGRLPNGGHFVRIFVERGGLAGLPSQVDGVPTRVDVSGMIVALSDPRLKLRPAPLGYSLGHPAITAGTLGARVIDATGNVFILSNNHVLANSNNASLGDAALQPGPTDGGTLADQIGVLHAFNPINFAGGSTNTMDAAIASVNGSEVGFGTPTDDGYGTPSGTIWGDANADGVFDNKNALLGVSVQKYGRTTKLTKGQITGINATLTICYEVVFIFCRKSASFSDQLIVEPGAFSGGGDSGSLIATDDANRNPVALLFAGSSTQTIANRIDLVLNHFGVRIDAGGPPPPPPDPLTDIAITNVSAPGSVTIGSTAGVSVTVRNTGNQPVAASFDVTLRDETSAMNIGTQSVAGLAAGALTTLTYQWNTTGASLGGHQLSASHNFSDDNAANNAATTTVNVNAPSLAIHVGDLDPFPLANGTSWTAVAEITVHDVNHALVNGATINGRWSRNGLATTSCTTGDLGGNATCIVTLFGLKQNVKFVDFTVTSVSMPNRTWQSAANHDPDGNSNGTTIRVIKP